MAHIVLNAEQAKVVSASLDPVEVRDEQGHVLGTFTPLWTREDIEQAKKVLADPNTKWYTFDEVMAHLRSLEKQ
jgi:hypothetical protein